MPPIAGRAEQLVHSPCKIGVGKPDGGEGRTTNRGPELHLRKYYVVGYPPRFEERNELGPLPGGGIECQYHVVNATGTSRGPDRLRS